LNAQIKSLASSYPLITRERTEKLELLKHLADNLAHAIIVCGPEGVGKTRLLKCFQDTCTDGSIFCWIKANNQLKLDKIEELLNESIVQASPELKSLSLANAFDRIGNRNNNIILIIDNAGDLAPGIIEKIIAFSERKSVLRVIFALTHSEIYLKNDTDPGIDDCYQIDIPPLSEKQCGEFLELLSTSANPRIQFSAINESMVAVLYSETHGIPGKILDHLPPIENSKNLDYSKPVLIISVIGLIALALGVQWWSSNQKADDGNKTNVEAKQNPEATAHQSPEKPENTALTTPPEAIPQPETAKSVEPYVITKPNTVRNDVIDSHKQLSEGQNLSRIENDQQPKPTTYGENLDEPLTGNDAEIAKEPTATEQTTSTVAAGDEGGRWLLAQPAENLTLQLMALSNEKAIMKVLQRHQALGDKLKYLKTKTKSGRDRFVLLYGSFSNSEQAKSELALLPKELQKNWVRKISAIQSEIGTEVPADFPE
jgi:DamX protein